MTMQDHDERWIEYFRAQGHPNVEPLATGMEGAVYRLGRGLVAKVWGTDKPLAELLAVQEFHADLARQPLPFTTPELIDVAAVDGRSVTIERELHGRPLQDHVVAGAGVPALVEECLGIVLESLASVPDLPSAHALAVLSEPRPFRDGVDWPTALTALLERRLSRFGDQLRAAVDDFPAVFALLTPALGAIGSRRAGVVHGDICGVNILVDDDLRPTALLDWGFLSTAGDPAFDASVASGIFEMYGDDARSIDDRLVDVLARRLGIPREHLLVYRAAYAVATSNAYDPEGSDGHFAWCIRTLRRGDVRDALHACAGA
jgi:Phosphotransferase enzyme family